MEQRDLILAPDHVYYVEAFDKDGKLKWREAILNAFTNEGLDELLNKFYKGSSYSAAHYVGLINNSPAPTLANADTMASHSGWAESADYSEANRQTITWGTVSGQSVNNSAAKAVFSINGTVTVYGAFVTTNNTKSGTTGILIATGAFSTPRSLINGDTLNVTVTATAARG
jgi:hypothetical protein